MLLLAVASGVLFPMMLIADVTTLEDIEAYRREEMHQGRGVVVVEDVPSNERSNLRSTCTRVAASQGPIAVGGLGEPQISGLVAYPGVGARLAHLDAGMWALWYPGIAAPVGGVAAGEGLATRVGLLVGDTLRVSEQPDGAFPLEAILADARPFAPGDGWLLAPSRATDPIDQCWIEFPEPVQQLHLEQMSAAFANLEEYKVRPLIRTSELTRDPEAEHRSRWSQWGSLAAMGICAFIYLLIIQNRKGEQAVYVTVGLNRAEDYVMSAVEVAIAIVAPAIFLSAVVMGIHAGVHDPGEGVHSLPILTHLLVLLATLLLLPLLSAGRGRTSILDDLKTQ